MIDEARLALDPPYMAASSSSFNTLWQPPPRLAGLIAAACLWRCEARLALDPPYMAASSSGFNTLWQPPPRLAGLIAAACLWRCTIHNRPRQRSLSAGSRRAAGGRGLSACGVTAAPDGGEGKAPG